MYKYINESVSYCLKEKIKKCTINLVCLRFLKLIELLYFISVTYLLIYDTTFIVKIGLYDNDYIAVFVCFFSILIGLALHFSTLWVDFLLKSNVISQFQSFNSCIITLGFLIKLAFLRFTVSAIKIITMLLFLLPSIIFQAVFYIIAQIGISKTVFIVCLIGCVLCFFAGFITGLLLCQRYNLAEYCCLIQNDSVYASIKYSKYLMDSKCKKLLKLKLRNIPYYFFGTIFPNLYIFAKSREFFLMTDKTIEYARKMHTQKSIVFYCKGVTA